MNLNGAANVLAFNAPDIWGPDPGEDPNNWANPNFQEPGANLQVVDLANAGGQGAGGHAAGGGPLAAGEPPAANRKHD